MPDESFRTALLVSSLRAGSTALNLSLIRHPQIFGWPYELGFFRGIDLFAQRFSMVYGKQSSKVVQRLFHETCVETGWSGEPWVLHKDPHDSKHIEDVVENSGAERVILLVRNPYAIVHSLLEHFFDTVREAAFHVRDYYSRLLRFEQAFPELVTRVLYEDVACKPAESLAKLLEQCLGLEMDAQCLDLSRASIPRNLGDHKVMTTTGWRAELVDLWRVGLSDAEKEFVGVTCRELLGDLGYAPVDGKRR